MIRTHGENAWDDMLEVAGLEGGYTSLGSYPDQHLMDLVAAASAMTGDSAQGVVRWFGREAMPVLASSYPRFFDGHSGIYTFLYTLNDIIHPELRKLYPGADVPVFGFSTAPDGAVTMTYDSHRKMCAFAEGLTEGAAAHFGQIVRISQTTCMLRGDAVCTIEVRVED